MGNRIFAVGICLILFLSVRVVQAKEEWDGGQAQMDQILKENEISFEELETAIENSSLKGDYTFSDLVASLLQGDWEEGILKIQENVKNVFFQELEQNKKNFTQIFLLAVLAALFSNIAAGFASSTLEETGFFVVYLSMTGLILSSFFLMYQVAEQTLLECLSFMEAFIPAYAMAVTMVSGSASSIALYEMTFFLIRGCQWILCRFLLPVIQGYMLIGIANCVGETDRFGYLISLIKKGSEQVLKWCVAFVIGLNLIQNMILPAVDSVKSGVWQKGLMAIPGAGPIASTIAGSLLGSGVLLKNSIGVGGLIFLVLAAFVPFLKIFCLTLSFYLSAALLQPISDKRLIQLVHIAGESGRLFLQVILTCCTLFFITIALAAVSTNMRYYAG